MAFAYAKVGGAMFKVNAGFEEREGRTICRWILVWQEIDDSTLAGALAGYSGGVFQYGAILCETLCGCPNKLADRHRRQSHG